MYPHIHSVFSCDSALIRIPIVFFSSSFSYVQTLKRTLSSILMAYYYVIIIACFTIAASAYLKPSRTIPDKWFRRDNQNDKVEARGADSDEDQEIEASERRQDHEEANSNGHPAGRVQIKVYRGPYDEHEQFAPHGFWVKQPADGRR